MRSGRGLPTHPTSSVWNSASIVDGSTPCTRTTRTQAGDDLNTRQGWQGTVPSGITQISTPNNSVLVIGRMLVYSDSDLPTAYGFAKLIQLAPLSSK